MANLNQYLLITAMVFASCTIMIVHVFIFPLYDTKLGKPYVKSIGEYEQSFCTTNNRRAPNLPKHTCPQEGFVTVSQGGRLGNQMWEYASVWAVARATGLAPYVPRCIRSVLDGVFFRLSIPPLYRVSHCPVQWNTGGTLDEWSINGSSILLPRFVVMPELVLVWANDIRKEFRFKPKLVEAAQSVLRSIGVVGTHNNSRTENVTYVGVHVRRTDYRGYLWRTRKMDLADAGYFRRAMDYFRHKYKQVVFMVVSDESFWCWRHLAADDVLIVSKSRKNTNPGHDLAVMAACNHSIIDYGTFGVWGAILAGGETVLYNITRHSSVRVSQLLAHWQVMS